MTAVLRRPLTNRQLESTRSNNPASPVLSLRHATSTITHKRARSPDFHDSNAAKKVKSTLSQSPMRGTPAEDIDTQHLTHKLSAARDGRDRKDKLLRKEQRENANKEFLTKYTKAFPSFVFYFDDRDGSRQHSESRVLALGARIELFFSASVTHVITNRTQPSKNEQSAPANKENVLSPQVSRKEGVLRSPIEIRARAHDHGGYDKLVRDAVQLHKKIWSVSKLENILSRLVPSHSASKTKSNQHSTQLNQLLHHERIHGMTSERDPRERRHDYQYFSKQSYFFLVEDIYGEIAPIAIMEYSAPSRIAEKDREPSYPVLYMDNRARSPFVRYDEREARKQNKIEISEKLRDMEQDNLRAKLKRQLRKRYDESQRKKQNLRHSASMMQIRDDHADLVEFNVDESGSGHIGDVMAYEHVASGFGQSVGQSTGNGYLAASGNSVPITSTTTTSLPRGLGCGSRLPTSLREQLARQVVTNRRIENAYMGEPRLRKAKSTTTMRLPTREENRKPGYCEACRIKFGDFKDHIHGSRHRKFAQNENNYIDLDFLLCRLKRKPSADVDADVSEATCPPIQIKYNTSSLEGTGARITAEDDVSDTCLGPGDYFYVSPNLESDRQEGGYEVPQVIIEDDA